MFGKSSTERVDETVDFLAATTVVPVDVRSAVTAVVKLYLAAQFPNTGAPAFNTLSGNMSLGARPGGQPKDPRKTARAIYLLWQAMHWADTTHTLVIPYPSAAAVPLFNVDDLLEFTIYKALAVYDAKNNSDVAARRILNVVFRADPLRFLTWNKVIVHGSGAWASRAAGGGTDRNVLPFKFRFDPAQNRYIISQNPWAGAWDFNAASIVATHWTRVPGRTAVAGATTLAEQTAGSFDHIQPVKLAGADIVVTTQFTGCTLCIRDVGGTVYAAHIAPGEAINTPPALTGGGQELAQQLMGSRPAVTGADFYSLKTGAHLVGGPMTIYGREHSNHPLYPAGYGGLNLQYFTMVGFQVGMGWEMFAQENMVDGSTVNIRRIFP